MKFKFIKSKDFDFIRSLIKNWDEFREDSNLLLLNYPQIKEKEFWVLGHFYINSSLVYAKIRASKNIPEIIKNSNLAIIEIYCSDFIEEEPIATKSIKGSWIHHPFLKDCDFWDFTGNSGY